MVIDFHTRRELDLDVAAIRAEHSCQKLQMAHAVNHQVDAGAIAEEGDSSERLRQMAARLRNLAADMRNLQNGCLDAMNGVEWRR